MAAGTVVLTGAASGIGLATARTLLSRPEASTYNYIFTVRPKSSTPSKSLEDLISSFNSSSSQNGHTTSTAQIIPVDLTDHTAIRDFASNINAQIKSGMLPHIKALMLNAGINNRNKPVAQQAAPTNDFEAHFQVNYLANIMLSLFLLESLDRENGARIVYTASWSHDPAFWMNKSFKPDPILWKDDACEQIALCSRMESVKKGDEEFFGPRLYGASKMWLVMGMLALQKKLDANPNLNKIGVIGVDPGGVLSTSINRLPLPSDIWGTRVISLYTNVIGKHVSPNGLFRTEDKSAGDLVRAALLNDAPIGESPKGLYLNGSKVGVIAPEAKDVTKQEKLWEASLKFASIMESDTLLSTASGV